MQRIIILAVSLLVLLASIRIAWNHRYERVSADMVFSLGQLTVVDSGAANASTATMVTGMDGRMKLRLEREKGGRPVVARFGLPVDDAFEAILISARITADGLVPGKNAWNDGRFNVVWLVPGSELRQHAASTRHDDANQDFCAVSHAPLAGARPQLDFAHLGQCGVFEITDLVATPVKQRGWWHPVSATLAVLACVWMVMAIRLLAAVRWWRVFAAAVICYAVTHQLVIPGPWLLKMPIFAGQFALGHLPAERVDAPDHRRPAVHDASAFQPRPSAAGRAEPKRVQSGGNLILQIRYLLEPFGPAVHLLFFFGLGAVLTSVVQWRAAVLIAFALSMATELAQVAFWGSCDFGDLADLLMNGLGAGIGAAAASGACWCWRRRPRRRPSCGQS